jgi:GNAT superfamily N-acetyltransferase
MEIRVVGYAHPDAQRLIAEVQQEYVVRYGDIDVSPVDPAEFDAPNGLFAVAYDEQGEPVGSGAWRACAATEAGLADGDAELKRMYTVPSARGRGLARRMLRHLEAEALAAGRRRMVLSTGSAQPEALALYAAEGYLPTLKFGVYREHPDCVCLAKTLSAPVPVQSRQGAETGAESAAESRMG